MSNDTSSKLSTSLHQTATTPPPNDTDISEQTTQIALIFFPLVINIGLASYSISREFAKSSKGLQNGFTAAVAATFKLSAT